jgi:tetratricopeptide (TPR) repeat protein
MRFAITIVAIATVFSPLPAQQSGPDTSERNPRLFTTDTLGANGRTETTQFSSACTRLNNEALAGIAGAGSAEVENLLSAALVTDRHDPVCGGLIMNNIAALLFASGRVAEAKAMATRSVHNFEERFPPDDPVLLRPLQILAATQFEQGETARSRETFQKMKAIRATRPEDRELVNAMAASLLEAEGRWKEAEFQYAAAIQELKDDGRGDTSDAGSLLNGIGGLYVKERRMAEARRALDDALGTFERARDATPWDRIKVLHTRATLCARQGEWRESEQDLANAVSIADRDPRVEAPGLRSLLIDYAAVLRKNRKRGEARAVEKRAAALEGGTEDRWVVDVTDLRRPNPTGGANAR